MSISPFSARPASPGDERRRARLIVAIAIVGIAATLLAYAISPGVRHAVGHAAHSVKRAVGHVRDRDQNEHKGSSRARGPSQPAGTSSRTTTVPGGASTPTTPGAGSGGGTRAPSN